MSNRASPFDWAVEVSSALARLTGRLLNERGDDGRWSGELSSSALSTAVAVVALRQIDLQTSAEDHETLIQRGLNWLAGHQNQDGGWGDTIRSKSNMSTTALCWAALAMVAGHPRPAAAAHAAERWLTERAGTLDRLPEAIAERYGKDRTFSVPILVTLAISGRFGPELWREIPALPFELAVLPRSLFGALRLPVVSYALPALIAIGNVIHAHAPSRNPLARTLRCFAAPRALALLERLQPVNGGFLEATPLTAFVTMSLAAAGQARSLVANRAVSFLRASVRADGSWPIDTNLSTWVTTLSIKALRPQAGILSVEDCHHLSQSLLAEQTKIVHPYTGAAPGAWAWTNLPGGVPDADDTAGALVALHHLGAINGKTVSAAEHGIHWLLGLQNSDGGVPTFCRGWGTLPFDRSTPEITAHALRAFSSWRDHVGPTVRHVLDRATGKALRFLAKSQRWDGSFQPLWFGNEHASDESNPVYGTAQVLIGLNEVSALPPEFREVQNRAARFLLSVQQETGGWGGAANTPESIEETALALEALAPLSGPEVALERGVVRLLSLLREDSGQEAAPIGLYFARLWYFERLYPLIFAVSALGRLKECANRRLSAAGAGASSPPPPVS